ncbi:TadE-like protein [Falsibacillus pallidus]|uniref:TadE-like protein n=2 Tax=Falsibacillus pallidus TaxID=493781 RepID=A0A370G2C7_9BACI|nr:TadE-like protein [Falsibacillus pallidus]
MKLKNEEGSSTIEFLGILPFILIVIMIAWQLIVTVQAIVVTQSAANEAAKVYSITDNPVEAEQAARKIVNTGGSYLKFESATGLFDKDFTTTVNVNIDLVFIPKSIFSNHQAPSISYSSKASGKVIKNES